MPPASAMTVRVTFAAASTSVVLRQRPDPLPSRPRRQFISWATVQISRERCPKNTLTRYLLDRAQTARFPIGLGDEQLAVPKVSPASGP